MLNKLLLPPNNNSYNNNNNSYNNNNNNNNNYYNQTKPKILIKIKISVILPIAILFQASIIMQPTYNNYNNNNKASILLHPSIFNQLIS